MIQIIKMAFRDLMRNRRRSFFSSLALGMGLSLLLLMASVITGEMRGSLENTIRLQSGHLQVQAETYEEEKTSLAWEDLVESPEEKAAQIAALPQVSAASPRLFASGILTTGNETTGVRVFGIDPDSPANDPYRKGLLEGSFITPDDREGLLIGQKLADKLGLKPGDQVNLLVNTSNGDVTEQPFSIRGVYSTGIPAFDKATLFLPLSKAQAMAQAENHASTIFVLLKDRDQTDAVAAALKTERYQVVTFMQANAMLATFEQFAGGYMVILYMIVLAITATVIVNTLVMAVFERTREIGILSAVGMKSGSIMVMFFIESIMLALGGIVIGLALGMGLVAYATYVGFYIGDMGITGMMFGERIYGYLTLKDTLTLSIAALVVTLLGALYPALLAARMEPVQALHGGQ